MPPWDVVAETVGIRRSRLFQLLGTEKLPEAIQADIRAGRLTEKQSRALQGLPGEHQRALRDAILADNLPADTAMAIARRLKATAFRTSWMRPPRRSPGSASELAQDRVVREATVADAGADLAARVDRAAADRRTGRAGCPHTAGRLERLRTLRRRADAG